MEIARINCALKYALDPFQNGSNPLVSKSQLILCNAIGKGYQILGWDMDK